MKKPSYAQIEADLLYQRKQNYLLARGLNALRNGETEFPVAFMAKAVVADEPGRYSFRFFDAGSPAGDKAMVTYSMAGQKDSTVVYDADEQRAWAGQYPGAVWARIFTHALHRRQPREKAVA